MRSSIGRGIPIPRSLVAAIPKIGGVRVTRDFWLQGEPPDPGNLPSGCRFRTRCPKAADLCAREEPALCTLAQGSGRMSFPGLTLRPANRAPPSMTEQMSCVRAVAVIRGT